MRKTIGWGVLIVVGIGACATPPMAKAADPEISITLEPVRQAFVDGDRAKFRAQHWMKDTYAGGIKNASGKHTFADGTVLETEGHALIDQNDLGGVFSLKKEHLGFFDLDYSEFRKYYDNAGGVYRRFATLQSNTTGQDLHLDIGKLGLETGLTLEGLPELGFSYERELKQGAKSRLTWPFATEQSLGRKIAPSWQDIDEIVDSFALTGDQDIAGFTFKGEQRWEFVRSENMREEANLATTGTASDTKIRRQWQDPQARLATTTLSGERSFLDDRVFFSAAFHQQRLKSREFERLEELSQAGVLTNYTYPEQKPNNRADSTYNSYTWVGNVMTTPWKGLSVGTKLKSELIKRRSNSTYNFDFLTNSTTGGTISGNPNGIPDKVDYNLSDTKAARWGQGLSVRLTAIPRTALFSDLEFEQGRMLLREDQKTVDGPDTLTGASATDSNNLDTFSRETVAHVQRGTWTLGGRVDPWSFLDLTSQVRRRVYNNDYDDQRETTPTSSSQKSAFFDGQTIHTDEFSTRVTVKPCRWFRPSFRYQFRNDKYATRAENEPIVKTGTLSHIYTFDVTVQPLRELTTTASFSRQNASVTTPAEFGNSSGTQGIANIPTFNANVNMWLLSADYAIKPEVSWSSTLQYARAKNFNDYAGTGLPYGVDNERVDVTTGVKWALTKGTSVGTEYAFYHYKANPNVEAGNYDAHVIWFDLSKTF